MMVLEMIFLESIVNKISYVINNYVWVITEINEKKVFFWGFN